MSKKSKTPEPTKIVKVIPQDLKDKWGSITAVATAANCLDHGYYPHKYASVVRSSIAYMAKLHETLVDDALKHPQAHMISELKEIQKQVAQAKKEAKKHGKEVSEAVHGTTVAGSVEPDTESGTIHPTPSPIGGNEAHP